MQELFYEMLDNRLDDVITGLYQNNAEYALSVHKARWLEDQIKDIINCNKDIEISRGDCLTMHDLIESLIEKASLETKYAYRQGYVDCAELLQLMNVLQKGA